jgi:PEP-CTERM putative exosortase interaction domain
MRKLLSLVAVATAAAAMPGAASAATCVAMNCEFTPGDVEFTTAGDTTPPITGAVSATIGRTDIGEGIFTDIYRFIVDADGFGSGSISTSLSGLTTDVDFLSVTINGQTVPIFGQNTDVEFAGISGVAIMAGELNELIVSGSSAGLGSYGGNLTFTPATAPIPEPATWAMMLMGFGGLGYTMRRSRRANARVQFA